jgi:hypothetical protein
MGVEKPGFCAFLMLGMLLLGSNVAFASSSLAVSSEELFFINVSEIKREIVLSVQNNDNILLHISLMLEPDFYFLKDKVSFDPQILEIGPAETKNLKVSLNIDEVYANEVGFWIQGYVNEHNIVENISKIIMKGPAEPDVRLDSMISDVDINPKFLVASVKMENTGNTLIRVKPKLVLSKKDEVAHSIEYPALPYIEPGSSETYSFRLEHDFEDFEEYKVSAELNYDNFSQEPAFDFVFTPEVERSGEEKSKATIAFSLILILIGIGVCGYFIARFTYYAHKHKSDIERVKLYEKKVKALEKRISYMIKETEKIINQVS